MEMLRNITAASAAATNPLLKSILGPDASEAEYKALAEQAESVWNMMDNLAEKDPDAYREFVQDAAKAAREEVEKSRDPHVDGLAPALVLEVQAQEPVVAGPATDVTRLVAGGQAVARIHIWAGNNASGVKPPYTAGGLSLGPQGPRSKDWSGLVVPVAEYRAATTRPGPLPMHNFHVVCHMDAIRMCIAGKSPVFRVVFLEAVSQFVESEYKLQLSRTTRTLQVHRDAVSEEELQELRLQQQQQVQACVGLELQPDRPAGDSVLPKGLLEELQSLGKPATKPSPVQGSGNPVPAAGAQTPRKALIEELN
ncbi:hypothetical protein Vretimale_531 [Volvox reticuliferus]|uniref:Uncharacterized protein n=1 Tax=Volvox reticuliferus TaxID=1737510 RepID=A0A8J4D323_9CHLO|nr:hypothetical protein Vretifemale_2438 [Volvox reticuliferus]GIL94325.1 hypothetical protein Vretimale_531 [Volvox reticuliferus]